MKNKIKFIKNAVKQFDKYKDYLSFKDIENGIKINLNKYNGSNKNISTIFNPQKIENFLNDILLNDVDKYMLFDNSYYAHPIRNLIKSLREFKLDESEQCLILNRFFTLQNTHDYILADYKNDYFYKYVKSEKSKEISKNSKHYGNNDSLSSLSSALSIVSKDLGQKNLEDILKNNLENILKNYQTEDSYGISNFNKFLISRGSKELYETFIRIAPIENEVEISKNLFSDIKENKEFVIKIDIKKMEDNYLLFKSEVARDIFVMFMENFFTKNNKDLHDIHSCEVFRSNNDGKNILTIIFSSDKDLKKDKLRDNISFFLDFFHNNLNFSDLPSSSYKITSEFKELLDKKAKSALMNRNMQLEINDKNIPFKITKNKI